MMYDKRKLSLLVLGVSMLTGAQEASAWRNWTVDSLVEYCGERGMKAGYETTDAGCDTCHASRESERKDGGEYEAGNYDYFCATPAVTPPPETTEPTCTDADGDGFFAEGGDCGTQADFDDSNKSAYPGAPEDCTDGIDNDGNGLIDGADSNAVDCAAACTDMDMDGYATEGGSCGAVDCDDNNDAINPGAAEICSDAIDNNCDGRTDTADSNAIDCPLDCTDSDGDGYSTGGSGCGPVDCDDNNAAVNPAALEICDDGVDNNCNSRVDSADSVCQSNEDGEDGCHVKKPWWRPRHKHGHHQDECQDSDVSNDDPEMEHSDDHTSRPESPFNLGNWIMFNNWH